jgi:hypothetical protein
MTERTALGAAGGAQATSSEHQCLCRRWDGVIFCITPKGDLDVCG